MSSPLTSCSEQQSLRDLLIKLSNGLSHAQRCWMDGKKDGCRACELKAEVDAMLALTPAASEGGTPKADEIAIVAKKYAAMEPTKWPHDPEPTDLIAHRNCAIFLARALLSRSATAHAGWTNVEDRLPIGPTFTDLWSDPVLVRFDSGSHDVRGCIQYSNGEISWGLPLGVTAKVVAWMPIPPIDRKTP